MRAGWEGNTRLQDFVRRVDSGASFIAEVVAVAEYETKATKAAWQAGTVSSGSVSYPDPGGLRIAGGTSTLVSHGPDDGANTTGLTNIPPFDALLIEWLAPRADDYEFSSLTARLDPRADGGQPKTVDHFIAEVFRVTKRVGDDELHAELIGRSPPVAATGEVEADFVFGFSPASGRNPRVGPHPDDGIHPQTLIRIIALRADGSIADNVTWLSDSAEGASKTDGSTYLVTHHQMIASQNQEGAQQGGTVWDVGSAVANMPEFSLVRSSYAQAVVTFTSTEAISDISGAGDEVIVARGEEWADSELVWEIWDGTSAWVRCYDGDVIGQDNRVTINGVVFGGDLSSIPTTGPWDIRVTLNPSTDGLRSPVAIEFGIERVTKTSLAGAAIPRGGRQQVEPVSLKANVPKAMIDIVKSGEQDFRDYGTEILAANHTGDIEVRVYVGDPSGTYLSRSEWMLHSVWEVEDYASSGVAHHLEGISPLRRLMVPIPPFVVVSGNDGTRVAQTVSGTRAAAWAEIVDSFVALPARFRGPGVTDTAHSVLKTITDGRAKEELDRIAFLGGDANIDSQGRLKAVKIMRDEPIDYAVARFPLGSYTPRAPFGPGFKTRTDEYFVRYNWEDTAQRFENERRYLNATALDKLGGAGIDTTQRLDEETSKWIVDQALADAVGDRVPKHFGNGQIIWEITANDRHPHLELGDVVLIETDLFVARSPINSQPIRGPLTAVAIVIGIDDFDGKDLDLWVPGFEYIVLGTGTVTRTIEIEYTKVVPASAFGGDEGELTPAGTGADEVFYAPVDIPDGAVITEMRSKGVRRNAGDKCEVILVGVTSFSIGTPPTYVSLALVTHTHAVDTDEWTVEETTGLNINVTSDRPKTLKVTLQGASTTTDAKLGWVEFTYRLAVGV